MLFEEGGMTCIVGLVDNGTVWIGGDSAGVAGWNLLIRQDRKVFTNGPAIMGFTTSFRMGQLLEHVLVVPEPPEDAAQLQAYMCTTFVDAIRECLKLGGWASKNNDTEAGGDFLVGICGRLFEINTDYQVGEAAAGFCAVGSGMTVALGALASTSGLAPFDRIANALAVAEQFNAGVRRPFFVTSKRHVPVVPRKSAPKLHIVEAAE